MSIDFNTVPPCPHGQGLKCRTCYADYYRLFDDRKIKEIREAPGYVPEFPPSRLIPD